LVRGVDGVKIRAAVTNAKESPLEIQELELGELRIELWRQFEDIERAAHEAEAGEVVKPVLRMS
jgi:hypothetical protein